MKKLWKLIKNWKSARVIVPADNVVIYQKRMFRFPDSVPDTDSNCIVWREENPNEIEGVWSYWGNEHIMWYGRFFAQIF